MRVRLTKIAVPDGARHRAAAWADYVPGQAPTENVSLPVGYTVEGTPLLPIAVGWPVILHRTSRNAVVVEGLFTSSPVREFGGGILRTENSRYRIEEVLPEPAARPASASPAPTSLSTHAPDPPQPATAR